MVDAGSIFSEVRVRLDLLKQDISSVEAEFDKFGTKNKEQTTKVEQDWSKGFNAASIAGVAAFVAIGAAVKAAIGVFAEFDDSMAQVRAVMTGSETDFADLEAAATKMGSATHFTAKEAADALYILSKSGREASESIELLHKAELLAGASGGSLADATRMIVQVMNQFGLGADSANRIVEVLASSRISLADFGNTLSTIGPVAAGMGIPLENLVAVLKVLQKTGAESGQATMSLKMILGELSDGTSATVKKLEGMGISFKQLNPATNTFAEIVGNLTRAGIGAEQVMAAFGGRVGSTMVALLRQGQEGIEKVTASITGTSEAAEMYEKRNATLADSMKEVGNAFDVSSGKIIKEFEPAMKSILEVAKQLINWIGNLPGPLKIFIGIVALGIPVIIGIASAIQMLGTVLTASAGIISLIVIGVAALVAAFAALPHLVDPTTMALDHAKTAGENLQKATDDLSIALKELHQITKDLTESTDKLTEAELNEKKAAEERKKLEVAGRLAAEVAVIDDERKAYEELKVQLDENLKQQVEIDVWRKRQIEGGFPEAEAQEGARLRLIMLSAAAGDLENQMKSLNEKEEVGIRLLAQATLAKDIDIAAIRKISKEIAAQVEIMEKRIIKENENADKKKKDDLEEAARAKEKTDKEIKYAQQLAIVNQTLEEQKTTIEKLRETLAKLQSMRLAGADEVARQKAIAITTAKITEEQEKLNKAKEKAATLLDEYKSKPDDLFADEIEKIKLQKEATLAQIDVTKEGWQEAAEAVEKYYDAIIDKAKADQVAAAIKGTWNTAVSLAQQGASAISDLINALGDARIADLDRQLQAELEAAGVAEDTAVEKAQKELDAAVEGGDAQLIAEKQRALTKAQIEEDYARKKAQIEYELALAAWNMQLVMAGVQAVQAVLSAYASASAVPLVGWILGPIAATAAGIFGAIQVAAVAAAKPQAPTFEYGGIVMGDSYSGDRLPAMVNSGEMILTREQQARLMALANGGGQGSPARGIMQVQLYMDMRKVAEGAAEYYEGGLVRLTL